MQRTAADPNRFAQDLFRPLPRRYDVLEELLSFGQNGRWRREMIAHVDHGDPSAILDVATGTAGVALALDAAYQRTDHGYRHHRGDAATRTRARRARRRGRPCAARRRASRTASLSRRLVRRAHVHLSAALRRRSRRDAPRARRGPQAGRGDRKPGVLGASEPVLAVLVVAVHARRVAGCGLCHRRSRVESGRTLPRTQHLRALRPLLRALDHSRRGRTPDSNVSAFDR